MSLKPAQIVVGVIAGVVIAGGSYAVAATSDPVIHGCINRKTRVLTIARRCGRAQSALSWSERGPAGARGPRGFRGARGPAGPAGAAATVSIGTVSTGTPGSQASVTNTGSGSNAVLDFTIPQGATGSTGQSGSPTAYGQIWMGSSSAQLAPGPSQNITGEGSVGVGGAVVDVQGCTTAGLANPVVDVTADKDPNDNLTGANNTTTVASAYVSGWSTEPDTSILVVSVKTTNPPNGEAVDSDFSIAVWC